MRLAILLACFLVAAAAAADEYRDARARLLSAYEAGDYAGMRLAADAALAARPEYPGALFNKALAEVLDGDADAAMATLGRLIAKQIDFGVENVEEFAPLTRHPLWRSYLANAEALRAPVGEATRAAASSRAGFVPEGIAVRGADEIILGSIRNGQVLFIDGTAEQAVGPQGHWSVFGMRLDGDGGLWFASSRVAQYAGETDTTGIKAGLFRLDLGSRKVVRRAPLPVVDGPQVLGDLVIAGDTIFTTDSVDGPVYRYSMTEGEYSTLVPRGIFGSPQGLVPDASGRFLYVADYIGGLYRVDVRDGHVEKLAVPPAISDYGIDGLYRHGRRLIAIQNGLRPQRVVAFELDGDGAAIDSVEILAMNLADFDEPTLGTVVGDDFYFVANSHWNRFDADNKLPDGLSGPIVLKLALPTN